MNLYVLSSAAFTFKPVMNVDECSLSISMVNFFRLVTAFAFGPMSEIIGLEFKVVVYGNGLVVTVFTFFPMLCICAFSKDKRVVREVLFITALTS